MMEKIGTAMEEIPVDSESTLVDKSLLDANLRQRFGVIVVAIQREARRMEFNPEPDTTIRTGGNGQSLTIPNLLPILPIRKIVVFPGTVMPLNVGRQIVGMSELLPCN